MELISTLEPMIPESDGLTSDGFGTTNTEAAFSVNPFDDAYEQNNSPRKAYDLTENEQTYLSDIAGEGVAFDDDFYKIKVTPGSFNVLVELEFTHANGNLDLFLYDSQRNLIAESTSTTDNELIDITVEKSGNYFIQVKPINTLGNTYDLKWDDSVPETAFRTIDGHDNNLTNPEWGAEGVQLLRLSSVAYEDGISEPRGGFDSTLPSAREISNSVAAQGEQSIVSQANLSDWFWQWGQFIDHDLSLTEPIHPTEAFDIEVPTGDPFFDPFGTGTQTIPLNRSIYDTTTGTSTSNPRQQINEITAYIDGSMVYGSSEAVADSLRAHDGTGKLLTSTGTNGEVLLPFASDGFSFLAGDIRVNEQLGLISVHTLFMREHNRIADKVANALENGNQKLTTFFNESQLSQDDFIYETARRVVGAEIQHITYNEFLPLLIGEGTIAEYTGYDDTVDAGISNEFSTAAYRVGHTMLSPQLLRVENDGSTEEIALRDTFFNPSEITADGIDSLLRGLGSQKAQEIDAFIIDDVRNFLFGPPGAGGFDLASLNIQRGRDHGIADINTVRDELGLSTYDDFDDLTGGDQILAGKFAAVYDSIDDVDLWMGGLAEKQVSGAVVGETFQNILADQFTRLRDGDRFWYENDPYLNAFKGVVDRIENGATLANIIKANSSVNDIQGNAFIVPTLATDTTII